MCFRVGDIVEGKGSGDHYKILKDISEEGMRIDNLWYLVETVYVNPRVDTWNSAGHTKKLTGDRLRFVRHGSPIYSPKKYTLEAAA